jgi:hypothetical protein
VRRALDDPRDDHGLERCPARLDAIDGQAGGAEALGDGAG